MNESSILLPDDYGAVTGPRALNISFHVLQDIHQSSLLFKASKAGCIASQSLAALCSLARFLALRGCVCSWLDLSGILVTEPENAHNSQQGAHFVSRSTRNVAALGKRLQTPIQCLNPRGAGAIIR
ncbi:hypothetical protein NDU88_003164 [Pleurodeles waltl]|uniref:Uncharacterized protein n=1 Tax=Pleurodeles waltl TaxID=8319 RepID=A0AAV7SEX0_PLEWA|nr:hypothetical protein NDU88_003164 [Pleurodeles waltl]